MSAPYVHGRGIGQALGFIGASTLLIAVTYGLGRYAYGLFVPVIRADFALSTSTMGTLAGGAYGAYVAGLFLAALGTQAIGARVLAILAGIFATAGLGMMAGAPGPWVFAGGFILAGFSTGLSSPPLAEAVSTIIRGSDQARVNAIINAGTSGGVALAGPVALMAIGEWRLAYMAFAAVALVATLWVILSVPSSRSAPAKVMPAVPLPLTFTSVITRAGAVRLMIGAFGMGLASSAFWTFGGDVVARLGGRPELTSPLWVVIGLAGFLGALAGEQAKHWGVTAAHRLNLAALSVATVLLVAMPGSLPAVLAAGIVFGAAFITLTGLELIWGTWVFPEAPGFGLGLGFLMIVVGQGAGAPITGFLGEMIGLRETFVIFAGIAVVAMIVRAGFPAPSVEEETPVGEVA